MFNEVVELYRGLGRPPIVDNRFRFEGSVDNDVLTLLTVMRELDTRFGEFVELDISGAIVTIEFSLPATEHGRFHTDFNDFLSGTPSLESGILPEHFYILDLNYCSADAIVPDEFNRLRTICEFIGLLSRLASESGSQTSSEFARTLVFVLSADAKSPPQTLLLRTKLTVATVFVTIPHANFLAALLSTNSRNVHVEERKVILRSAIAEVLKNCEDDDAAFGYLVKRWRDVLTVYRHNFLSFLSSYSFEKVRKEIANTEIELTTKLSAVLGDISGKVLALPVSLAGVVALQKVTDGAEFIAIVLGLIIVSIVLIGVLCNQWLQVRRINGSAEFILGQYDGKLASLPTPLLRPIKDTRGRLKQQMCVLKVTFLVFGALALIPGIWAICSVVARYQKHVIAFPLLEAISRFGLFK